MAAGTDIGNMAKDFMYAGKLVPDEVVTAVCMTYLLSQLVIDGFFLLLRFLG